MFKRIIAFLLVFASLFSAVVISAYALDDDYSSVDTVTFWEQVIHDNIGGVTDALDIFLVRLLTIPILRTNFLLSLHLLIVVILMMDSIIVLVKIFFMRAEM